MSIGVQIFSQLHQKSIQKNTGSQHNNHDRIPFFIKVTWSVMMWCKGAPVAVSEWLACLTDMWEVSRLNPASYLCWNMHVVKRLAAKRLAGVTPEVNLRECISHTPPPSANKAAHSGFEIQRCHQWPHKKDLCPPKFFLKRCTNFNSLVNSSLILSSHFSLPPPKN